MCTCIHKSQFVCSWKIHPLHSPFSAFLHVVHDSYSQQVSGSLAGPLRQLQYAGTTLRLGQIWKKDPARDAKDTEMSTIFEENAWKLNDDGCVWPNCTAKQDQHSRNIDTCLAAHATCCRIGDIPIGCRKELWWNPNRHILFRSEELEMYGEVSAQCRICFFVLLLY